jgi:hypothetical protein
MFVSAYGAVAGNVALTLFSLGGLYVGGRIAPLIDATIISLNQRSAGSLRRLLCEIWLKGMAGSGIGGGRTATRLSSREDFRLVRATVKIRSVPAIVFGATLQCGMISATRRAYPAAWIASSISVDASP